MSGWGWATAFSGWPFHCTANIFRH